MSLLPVALAFAPRLNFHTTRLLSQLHESHIHLNVPMSAGLNRLLPRDELRGTFGHYFALRLDSASGVPVVRANGLPETLLTDDAFSAETLKTLFSA